MQIISYFDHLKKCKYAYETKVASDIKDNPRSFYNYCRKFSRTASTIDCLNINGKRVTDDKLKAEALNDFFAQVTIDEDDNVPHIPQREDITQGLYDIKFDSADVFNTMSKLKPNKGSGPDGIHPHILKEVGALSVPLYLLFRNSLDKGALPEDWRIANICALHKKGNRTEANNYRPVSLTSQVVKVFERIIHKKINIYCEQNNIITCHQHGFLSRCSCLTNLLECLNDWTTAYDRPKTGIDIVYTDFRKAFDSVPHRKLLLKIQGYGIKGKVLAWLQAFLTQRKQRVILNGSFSKWNNVVSGVPQGTILGPVLFLLFINDLESCVNSTIKLFADDCKVYNPIDSITDCVRLQDDLNSVSAWSRNWQLAFNKDKCVVLRIKKGIDFTYSMDGKALNCIAEQRDLGVTISDTLKPSVHIHNIAKKANQRLGMIRRCFSNKSYLTIKPLYTTLVRPILESVSTAWNPSLQRDITELDKIQSRAEKLCTPRIKFQDLSERRRRADMCETYKILNHEYKLNPRDFFELSDDDLRGHNLKLSKQRSRTDIRRNFFSNRVVNEWNNLDNKTVPANNLCTFKERLELGADARA